MENSEKIQKIIRNLSGDKILQIRILISKLKSIDVYSVRAYLQKEYISVVLIDNEIESFKKILEENGWYMLYRATPSATPRPSDKYEKYFKLDNIIDIMVEGDSVENEYNLIYLQLYPDKTFQYLDAGNEKDMLLFKKALQKAGRYDLLLKLS